jgi:3-oxoadipate enol-lactonase
VPFVESKRRRIYYERHGEGPAVLFLHGAGSNAATWWQQLPAFPGFSLVTMDIRCFGRSAAPLDEFGFEHFTADALAVLDAERIQRAAVVGQSLGGMIGLRLALRHADRVSALVTCDSTLAVKHPQLLQLLRDRQVSQRASTIEQRSLGAWFLKHHPDRAALYAQINHFNPSTHTLSGEEWGATLSRLMAPEQLLPLSALAEVGLPTLFLVGREDPLVPTAVARELAEAIPGAELAVVADAGHSAYFEQPATFNSRVGDFLRRHVH